MAMPAMPTATNNSRYNFSPFARIIQTFFILSFSGRVETLVVLFAAFTILARVVVSFPALWRRCRALLSFYATAPVQIARNGIPNRARTPFRARRIMHLADRGIPGPAGSCFSRLSWQPDSLSISEL